MRKWLCACAVAVWFGTAGAAAVAEEAAPAPGEVAASAVEAPKDGFAGLPLAAGAPTPLPTPTASIAAPPAPLAGVPVPLPAAALGSGDEDREAHAWAEGREPATLQHGDDVVVPFGHQVPVLRCAPLRVCLVEMEEGEIVLNTVMGDSTRWLLDRAMAGPKGATSILVVKPTECNLRTNLAVTTTRRIYQITMESRPCRSEDQNPIEPYTRLLRFYYPDQIVKHWAEAAEAEREAARPDRTAVPLEGGVAVTALNFDYQWTRSGKYPWEPVAVFDDHVHTYIRVPAAGIAQESPILFLVDAKGAVSLLNYAIRGPYYVTDRVIDRAALVMGSGKGERRLQIVRGHER